MCVVGLEFAAALNHFSAWVAISVVRLDVYDLLAALADLRYVRCLHLVIKVLHVFVAVAPLSVVVVVIVHMYMCVWFMCALRARVKRTACIFSRSQNSVKLIRNKFFFIILKKYRKSLSKSPWQPVRPGIEIQSASCLILRPLVFRKIYFYFFVSKLPNLATVSYLGNLKLFYTQAYPKSGYNI